MVQTLRSVKILAGDKAIILERPHILHRIFMNISVIEAQSAWYDARISFDDPQFLSFFYLSGAKKYFEVQGEDIFQGDVWLYNASSADFWVSSTEILH